MSRPRRTAWRLGLLLLALAGPAAAELNIHPMLPVIEAPAGSSVVVEALLENPSSEIMYLGSVSTDLPPGFTGSAPFSEFLASAPDSLLPGESWEGPVIRLTVAPGAPVGDVHQVTLHFSGGAHPYDEQLLAAFTFALNDPTVVVSAPDSRPPLPADLSLSASPNPTRGSSLITFELARAQQIDVRVYDVSGAAIRSLVHGLREAGRQTVAWDGRDAGGKPVGAGIYFVRISAPDGMRHTKVVRVK